MKTLKKLTALLLTFVLAFSVSPAIFAGEIDCDGAIYTYEDEYMLYDDYRETVEKLQKYAKKGNDKEVNRIYTEELIPLEDHYNSILGYNELFDELGFLPAECEFDASTGTVIKVLNDAEFLAIPISVDGVPVTHIAEGAITGKTELSWLGIPPTVKVIDSVIVKDCPAFKTVDAYLTRFETFFCENCPSYDGSLLYLTFSSEVSHYTSHSMSYQDFYMTNLGMGFAADSGVIRGDENGNYNWYENLTRTEAAIMVLRLMGLEDEAASYASKPCSFTDVPEWAKGYINLAVEKGIVKGLSENIFGSSNPCGAKDFLTMLFRLTDLKEGTDFSWNTIIEDYKRLLCELDENIEASGINTPFNMFYSSPGLDNREHGEDFSNYLNMGGNFNRSCAAIVLYYMLNTTVGVEQLSLGDILAERYGMSDVVLYDYYVRRTAYGLETPAEDFPYPLQHAFFDKDNLINTLRERNKNDASFKADPEIKAFAESLIAGKTTEYDKAKTISKWIAEHIFYDYDHYEGRKDSLFFTAKDVFENRLTVCAGYSNLTLMMLKSVGIECYKISSTDHAWNVAVLDGKVTLIDNTWDSPLEYRYGKYYIEGEYSGEETIAKNIKEPGAKWHNDYFDCENSDFYTDYSHMPLRMPKRLTYNPWEQFEY